MVRNILNVCDITFFCQNRYRYSNLLLIYDQSKNQNGNMDIFYMFICLYFICLHGYMFSVIYYRQKLLQDPKHFYAINSLWGILNQHVITSHMILMCFWKFLKRLYILLIVYLLYPLCTIFLLFCSTVDNPVQYEINRYRFGINQMK